MRLSGCVWVVQTKICYCVKFSSWCMEYWHSENIGYFHNSLCYGCRRVKEERPPQKIARGSYEVRIKFLYIIQKRCCRNKRTNHVHTMDCLLRQYYATKRNVVNSLPAANLPWTENVSHFIDDNQNVLSVQSLGRLSVLAVMQLVASALSSWWTSLWSG
jgi:hypothetical protein